MATKQFLLTLKSPVKVQQRRADNTAIILKTTTLQVEWPLDENNTPVEDVLVNLHVMGFAVEGDTHFWESPLRESGCEPFEIQLRRDLIMTRQ